MSAGLKVVVEGIIYQYQSHGGISRLYSEILPRMCDLDESLRIELLTTGKLKQTLPTHSRISHRSIPRVEQYLRPGRLWRPIVPRARQCVRKLWIGRGEGQIWHSTYYTLPESWDGLQVVTVIDMVHERFTELFSSPRVDQFIERKRRCVQQADAVICISEATRQDVQCFYRLDPNSVYTIPLACSNVFRQLEQSGDDLEMPTGRPFLLFVGGRTHHKNFDRLIRAYGVWTHRKEVTLVVVGAPWSVNEKRLLAKLGIQDCVYLFTDLDDEALCQLYNRAAAFIYPSLYEGFGIPLLEAMACGCPIVASRIPSTIEVAEECPVYFDLAEVESLLAALDVALSEGRDLERVRAGAEHVKSYSWDKTATRTLEVYYALSNLK